MPYSQPRYPQQGSRSFSQAAQAAPGRLYDEQGNKTGGRIDGRVKAATLMGGGDQGSLAGRGQFWANANKPAAPSRADNIAASRADGTFDAKRNAFNSANKGSFMDAAGNIGPKAGAPAASTSTIQTGASQESPQKPGGPKTTSVGGSYGSGTVEPMTAQGSLKGARFKDDQGNMVDRQTFFSGAAKRQGVGNAFADVPKDAPATPTPASPMSKAAAAPMPANTPKPTTETPAGVPKPTFTDAGAKDRYNKSMASISDSPTPTVAAKPQPIISPAGSQASQSSMPTKTGMASSGATSPVKNRTGGFLNAARAPAIAANAQAERDAQYHQPVLDEAKAVAKVVGKTVGKVADWFNRRFINNEANVPATAEQKAKFEPDKKKQPGPFKIKAIAGTAGARG